MVFITYLRQRMKLLSYGRIVSFIPTVYVPAFVTILTHQSLVTQRLLNYEGKEPLCPVCIELRAITLQVWLLSNYVDYFTKKKRVNQSSYSIVTLNWNISDGLIIRQALKLSSGSIGFPSPVSATGTAISPVVIWTFAYFLWRTLVDLLICSLSILEPFTKYCLCWYFYRFSELYMTSIVCLYHVCVMITHFFVAHYIFLPLILGNFLYCNIPL